MRSAQHLRLSTRQTKVFGQNPTLQFQYALARELGMTWRRLISEMGTSELIHWMAFFRREQRDQDRARERASDNAEAMKAARGMAGRMR